MLDGGGGRDLVDYQGVPGVNASLPGKAATVRLGVTTAGGPGTSGQVLNRNDVLDNIERISGSPNGDILTGGPGSDELLGGGGPDNIRGAGGPDTVDGGPGVDDLDGGDGADVITGGPGNDTFGKPTGDDTINSRDGFIEDIACTKADVIVSDLVDRLASPAACSSVSVAAAKHLFDTQLVALRAGPKAVVACPIEKTEPCSGPIGTSRRRRPRSRTGAFALHSPSGRAEDHRAGGPEPPCKPRGDAAGNRGRRRSPAAKAREAVHRARFVGAVFLIQIPG